MASRTPSDPTYPHKKVNMLTKGQVVTIKGDNLFATITNKGPVLEIENDYDDEELYSFEIVATLEKDRALFDFILYSSLNVNAILKIWGYPRACCR